ncbi:MAG: adenylyl-sulfate kinase [Pseudomonadota bacterium]
MIVWITGISGAGKTTLCNELSGLLKPSIPELVVIDGDFVRETFGNTLGYKEQDRVEQIQRIQRLARELDRQGLVVLVAALYANSTLLAWNRDNFNDYFEIYLDAPLTLVQSRDAKGLYAKAARGEMPDVVGIDVPWHAPQQADLHVDAAQAPAPSDLARDVAMRIPQFAAILATNSASLSA